MGIGAGQDTEERPFVIRESELEGAVGGSAQTGEFGSIGGDDQGQFIGTDVDGPNGDARVAIQIGCSGSIGVVT